MVEDARSTLTGRLWRVISWPLSAVLRLAGGIVRRHGPVKAAMGLLAGICGVLILWNLVIAPAMMGMILAHIPKPVVPVVAAEAKAVTWTPGLEAVGTAKAFQGADLAAEADGVITAIDVAPQTEVTAGQRLIQIDDAVEQADLIAMQANVKLKETALSRASTLTSKGVNAQSQLDDARNQLDVAKSQLARVAALIDQKTTNAPFGGMAGIPRVNVGQYVTKGTVLITLQDLQHVYVDFTVPEQSAGLLGLGQTVHVGTVKDELDYDGHIIGIDPKVDPQTRLVAVRAEIADAKGRIRPGQFLQLRIDLPVESNVVVLPTTAVVPSLYGDYVYLVVAPEGDRAKDDGKTRIVRQAIVTTGRRSKQLVEISKGLSPGQWVVATGQNAVQSGATVEITSKVDSSTLADVGARP